MLITSTQSSMYYVATYIHSFVSMYVRNDDMWLLGDNNNLHTIIFDLPCFQVMAVICQKTSLHFAKAGRIKIMHVRNTIMCTDT